MLKNAVLTGSDEDYKQELYVVINDKAVPAVLLEVRIKTPLGSFMVHIPSHDYVVRYNSDGSPYDWPDNESVNENDGRLVVKVSEQPAYIAVVRRKNAIKHLFDMTYSGLDKQILSKDEVLHRSTILLKEPEVRKSIDDAYDTRSDLYMSGEDYGSWFAKHGEM